MRYRTEAAKPLHGSLDPLESACEAEPERLNLLGVFLRRVLSLDRADVAALAAIDR